MENLNELSIELEEFNRANEEEKTLSSNLEKLIEYVAKTGKYIFPWPNIRKLFIQKLKNVLTSLNCVNNSQNFYSDVSSGNENNNNGLVNDSLKDIKDRLIERMESFTSAPFTIQRICELLIKPNNNYKQIDKYLRGLEKCMMVVTTVDPNGNKIFIESIAPDANTTEIHKQATPKIPTPFHARDENSNSDSNSPSNLDVTNLNNSTNHESSSSSPSSSSSSSLNTTIEHEDSKLVGVTTTEVVIVTTEAENKNEFTETVSMTVTTAAPIELIENIDSKVDENSSCVVKEDEEKMDHSGEEEPVKTSAVDETPTRDTSD